MESVYEVVKPARFQQVAQSNHNSFAKSTQF